MGRREAALKGLLRERAQTEAGCVYWREWKGGRERRKIEL